MSETASITLPGHTIELGGQEKLRLDCGVELGPFPTEVRAQHVARELEVDMGIDARVIVEP